MTATLFPIVFVSAEVPNWGAEVRVAPKAVEVKELSTSVTTAVLLDGLDYNGKQTQFFAYWDMPDVYSGQTVPGIVLLHGGGGTARKDWVNFWVRRGYAAISIYWVERESLSDPKVPSSYNWNIGPRKIGTFLDYTSPIEDQWMYHAVADTMLAQSFLAAQAGVDAERIGLCGVSWGGIIASYVMGVDERFAFAIPIYGTGYLVDSKAKISEDLVADAVKIWDPSTVLGNAKMPTLFINSNNDTYFSLNLQAKAQAAVKGSHLSIQNGLSHGHDVAFSIEEAYSFADSIVASGTGFINFLDNKLEFKNDTVITQVSYEADLPLKSATLWYTTDDDGLKYTNYKYTGTWQNQLLSTATSGSLSAQLPVDTKGYYIETVDSLNRISATPYVEFSAAVGESGITQPEFTSVVNDAESAATLPLDAILRAKSLITNGDTKPLNAMIVLAIYDKSGRMISVSAEKYSIAELTKKSCIAEIDITKLDKSLQNTIDMSAIAKAFVFDSANKLKPLCAYGELS